jgi:ribonuclease J
MKVCIHRGSHEIGGSCIEVISKGKRLIIDLGLPINAEEIDEKYLPDVKGLDGSDQSLLAIIISHPHLDHFGLLGFVSDKIPVAMGASARRILKAAIPFLSGNWPDPTNGPDLKSGVALSFGPFLVTPFLVDHSGYDAYALLIETDGKKLFYSGDLRMHGRKGSVTEQLMLEPPKDIDVLLLEGSSINRLCATEQFLSEKQLEADFTAHFKQAKGLALVHASSQNIDRIVTIFRACKRSNRSLIIDLYTAAILEATGNPRIPQSHWPEIWLYIPERQRGLIKQEQLFDLLNRHSQNRIFPEDLWRITNRSVLLFRPIHIRDLERAVTLTDATYIYSQWEGYWNQESNEYLRIWIESKSIPKISLHTSGHASPIDLQRFASAMSPKKIVPIHTFNPQKYKELFPLIPVSMHRDGKKWTV